MTARLLDTGSHGPYASRRIGHGLSERMDVVPARSGLCSKAGLGQDALEGTKIRAHASKCMAMRDRRMKQAAPARGCAAGWGHAQATPLVAHRRLVLEQAPSLNQKRTCSTRGLPWTDWSGLFMRSSSLCWVE